MFLLLTTWTTSDLRLTHVISWIFSEREAKESLSRLPTLLSFQTACSLGSGTSVSSDRGSSSVPKTSRADSQISSGMFFSRVFHFTEACVLRKVRVIYLQHDQETARRSVAPVGSVREFDQASNRISAAVALASGDETGGTGCCEGQ
jgi:hypothetical protein